jgi:hypothetical protein
MSLFVAWVFFPLVLLALSVGLGLLIERASGSFLPGVLIVPLGTAGIVVASQLTTYFDWSAELTTPLVVVLAVAGLGLGLARLRSMALDRWATAAAVGVFAVFAGPIVLSGEATFAGYTVLGDTSIQMIGSDQLVETGRDFDGLAPSSYEMSLVRYYDDSAYPSGGPTALGAVRPLVFEDVAWIYQPFLAWLAAMLALALYSLARPLVASPLLRAFAAFVAAQPALVVGYALQGSIKEVGIVFAVTLLAALVGPFSRFPADGLRRGIPLVVTGACAIALVGPAAAVWLGPIAVALIAIALVRPPRGRKPLAGVEAAALAGLLAVLSFPSLLELGRFLDADAFLTSEQEFGNLLGRLKPLQMFGIWLSGDYRVSPLGSTLTTTHLLIGIAIGSAALGVLWAIRRRDARELLLFFVVSFLAWAYVTRQGSPWADGKALMIISPAVVLAAMLGPAALAAWGRRLEALLLAGTIAGGVLASSAYAYHDVSLAPRDRLEELASIGERTAGEGPTLYNEFEEFGKHFLRNADPEGSSEGWQRRYVPLRSGQYARQGFSYDLDQFRLDYVRAYRTIVVRKSPVASRPPSSYRLVSSGRYYEVWQREPERERSVVEHLPLGSAFQRGGNVPCGEVRRLARTARRSGGELAFVPAPKSFAVLPASSAFPPTWFVDGSEGFVLRPRGPGKIEDSTVVTEPGPYELWIEGSFGRGYDVWLDGRRVGHVEDHLNGRDQYGFVTAVQLDPGRHVVTLFRGGGSLRPGDGVLEFLGPILLTQRLDDPYAVRRVPAARAESLCGRWLDWVEAVRD